MSEITTSPVSRDAARNAKTLFERAAPHAAWLAVLSAAILLLVVSGRPQGLHFYDQAMQTIALQQWLDGTSPTLNTVVRADPADASRDVHEWLSWWPPSLQLLALPFVSAGLTIGTALRLVFAAALMAGSIGWVLWIRKFQLPAIWVVGLALALPWLRHASENAFRYSAEILSFGLAPWLLLLLLRVPAGLAQPGADGAARLAVAGLALGFSYTMKYSLFVFALCGLLFVGWENRRAWATPRNRRAGFLKLALLSTATAAIPLALRFINARQGSTDPVVFGGERGFNLIDLVYAFANPALALADAQGPLFHALVFPGVILRASLSQRLGGLDLLAWIALPAGILLAAMLAKFWRSTAHGSDAPGRLAVATLALNSAALFVLWQIAEVDHMARHIAPAALATLPLAIREGIGAWRTRLRSVCLLIGIAGLVFVVGPLAYGFVYVGAKCHSIGPDYRSGRSGLNLPTLSRRDVPAVIAELRRHATPETIWIVEDPEMALEVPGRFMLVYGDRDVGREMRRLEQGPWRSPGDLATSREVTLLLLLQRGATPEADIAHARRITDPITGARNWQRHVIAAASFTLWTGTLYPSN